MVAFCVGSFARRNEYGQQQHDVAESAVAARLQAGHCHAVLEFQPAKFRAGSSQSRVSTLAFWDPSVEDTHEIALSSLSSRCCYSQFSMGHPNSVITAPSMVSPNSAYPPNHPLSGSKHLCSICGDRASGKHYGVYR